MSSTLFPCSVCRIRNSAVNVWLEIEAYLSILPGHKGKSPSVIPSRRYKVGKQLAMKL